MGDLPLIIGHRGASAVAPENTLLAFEEALKLGADGVEFDVRLARDEVPVVIHDRTLSRTGMIKGVVSELDSEELKAVDVGTWFRRKSALRSGEFENQKVPTLQQALDLFKRLRGVFYLEMKSEGDGSKLAAEVVKAIQLNQMTDKVVVSSFDLSLIAEAKKTDAGIRTSALFEPNKARPLDMLRRLKLIGRAKAFGADEISLHNTLAGRRVVEKALQSDLEVVVWTVDNPRWIKHARSWGVKALITNDPGPMIRFLKTQLARQ